MIFQEPMTALNPVLPVGRQIAEVLEAHGEMDAQARRARVVEIMDEVHLPEPGRLQASYPHQLSGGQRQRVMIAMALVLRPALLIADEPTTALDVTTQRQILALVRELRESRGTAVLFITHDMGVVSEIADEVAVLKDGALQEVQPVDRLLRAPRTDYARALLQAVPSLVPRAPRTDAGAPVVLETRGLAKTYREAGFLARGREVHAARDVDLALRAGRTLGIVGESGSGKSTVARCIVRLIDPTVRFHPDRRRGDRHPLAPRAQAPPPPVPDRVPGPVPLAQPAPAGGRLDHGRTDQLRRPEAREAIGARAGADGARGPARRARWSASRTSSRAASASASPSPARSPWSPTC